VYTLSLWSRGFPNSNRNGCAPKGLTLIFVVVVMEVQTEFYMLCAVVNRSRELPRYGVGTQALNPMALVS
jgi:hypothetical protein